MQKASDQTNEKWQTSGKQNLVSTQKPRSTNISRTSIAYWKDKIYKPKVRGQISPYYSVRISYKGRRVYFSLETPDKEHAARTTKKIYQDIVDYGWELALEKHRPEMTEKQSQASIAKGNTVGDLIIQATRFSRARRQSINTYIKAFRRIVSELEGLTIPKRFNGSIHQQWVESVDRVELSLITPERVSVWRNDYIAQHGKNAAARKSSITTANSCIRNAKALFNRNILNLLENHVKLPNPLPFEGISQLNAGTSRYNSKMDAKRILRLADAKLKQKSPQAYLILQLALRCGLRVSEIDHLLWSSIDLGSNTLHVQATEFHQPKSEDSEGSIDLSDETVEILREFQSVSQGKFVVDSTFSPTHNDKNRRYRCRKHLKELRAWLRLHGVKTSKPIHELRKEVGSVIANEHGIYAASRFLRHSDIQITSSYYIDKKSPITPTF